MSRRQQFLRFAPNGPWCLLADRCRELAGSKITKSAWCPLTMPWMSLKAPSGQDRPARLIV
jgi:hypothetical protein